MSAQHFALDEAAVFGVENEPEFGWVALPSSAASKPPPQPQPPQPPAKRPASPRAKKAPPPPPPPPQAEPQRGADAKLETPVSATTSSYLSLALAKPPNY